MDPYCWLDQRGLRLKDTDRQKPRLNGNSPGPVLAERSSDLGGQIEGLRAIKVIFTLSAVRNLYVESDQRGLTAAMMCITRCEF